MKTKSLLQAGALALALTATSLPAAVIFKSISTDSQLYQIDNNYSVAQGFTVGASSYTLTSVVLTMGNTSDTTGTFHVALWSGDFSSKLGDLAPSSGADHPGAAGDYTYNGPFTLAASTTYNVVASMSGGTGMFASYLWNFGNKQAGSISAGTRESSGGSWSSVSGSGDSLAMTVNADLSPVPEPSEWAAVSVAMLGLVYVAKRRLAPVRQ